MAVNWRFVSILALLSGLGLIFYISILGRAVAQAGSDSVPDVSAITLGPIVVAVLAVASTYIYFRKRAARLLEVNAALSGKLDAVTEAVQNGIVGLTADGMVAFANARARQFLGQSNEETPFEWPETAAFVDSDGVTPLPQSASPLSRAACGASLRDEPATMRRTDGARLRHVSISSVPMTTEVSKEICTVLVIDDVSDQEERRQQYERASRLDALGQLTGGIAHDFNNLLATIEYGIQLADKETRADKRCIYHSAALASVRRGASLTQRLLTFAKKQPGLAKSHSVNDVFHDFSQLAGATIEENIQLTFLNETPDLSIYCDLGQFENALLNLVINSRDAILREGKGSSINITAKKSEGLQGIHPPDPSGRGFAEICVSDDGPGMSEEVRGRATDPFFTTKDSNSGSGLGLSMVYGFAQQSNGALKIESDPGGGSIVRIYLPLGQSVPESPEFDQVMPEPSGEGQVILVVEDEAALLEMMEQVISALGYQVLTANSGAEAIEIAQHEDFDLLLTDVVMPKVGGFQLAREIRDLKPGLPIIYMSGYTGFSESEMGAVVAPLIRKPSAPATLADALSDALRAPAQVA